MRKKYCIILLPIQFLFALFRIIDATAQVLDNIYYKSADSLQLLYKIERIDTVNYLNNIDAIASIGWGQPGYYESLHLYREIAFALDTPSLYRVKYYSYLAIDAEFRNLYGRCIYYKKKEVAEYKRLHPGLEEDFSLPLFLVSLYSSTKQRQKAGQAYFECLPALKKVPSQIMEGKQTPVSAENALKVIAYAAGLLGNNQYRLNEALQTANSIYAAIQTKNDSNFMKWSLRYKSYLHIAEFWRCKSLSLSSSYLVENELNTLQNILLSDEYLRSVLYKEPYVLSEVYFMAAHYYATDRKQPDSARRYLNLLEELGLNKVFDSPTEYYILQANIARQKGMLAAAYEYMDSALYIS